jgi:hypothetical protein
MRNELLLITTILVVGTASAATFAFYQSPDKTYALLGKPRESENLARQNESQVAGEATQRVEINFPGDIPIFKPSEVVSSSKSLHSAQLTLKTSEPSFKVSNFYKTRLRTSDWTEEGETTYNSVKTLTYSKLGKRLGIKISSSPYTGEIIVDTTYTE